MSIPFIIWETYTRTAEKGAAYYNFLSVPEILGPYDLWQNLVGRVVLNSEECRQDTSQTLEGSETLAKT